MAEAPLPAVEEPQTVSVQEVVMKGAEVPHRYICKDIASGPINSSVPLLDIPVIDLALLSTSSPAEQEAQDKLRTALTSFGCFHVINHGMTAEFLDQLRYVSSQFFGLSTEEKKKYSREVGSIEGYGSDMILADNQTLDWTDRLYIKLAPVDQRKLKFWPQNPQAFRETLDEYSKKLVSITEVLIKAMARSLNLEESRILKQYGERPAMEARFNCYPPCPRPDLVLGLKPHSDGSVITTLLQDKEVEGLQILKHDKWFTVPIVPEALLVNAGDQLEIMSNGIFKSPVHRAVTNSDRVRISIAVFSFPSAEQEIEPMEELVSETIPRSYKKVRARDYVSAYFQYYQQGKRPIESALV